MHRNEGANMNLEDGTTYRFQDQDLPGTAGSTAAAEWGNALTDEIANVISYAGLSLVATATEDRTAGWVQLKTAIFLSAAMTSAGLAASAVTTTKIADGAVTSAQLGYGAVTSTKLGAGSVTEAAIGNREVTANKIAENGVTNVNIGDNAVAEDQLADGAVTSDKLGTNAVTNAKLADSSVNTAKLANNSVTRVKTLEMDKLITYTGDATLSTQTFTIVRSTLFVVTLIVKMTKTNGTAGSTGQNKFKLTDDSDVDITNGATIIRLAEVPLNMEALDKTYRFPVHLYGGTYKLVVDCSVGAGETLDYFIQVENKD